MNTQPSVVNQCKPDLPWKAGLLLPGLLLIGISPAFADHLEKHFKVDARPEITLHNPSGTVVVKAWTKSEVMVIATRASDDVEVDATQTGNRVDIMTHPVSNAAAMSAGDSRADFEIRVPEDAELQIHDDSGTVSVNSVLGDMNVETVGAGVDLSDDAGYLTVKTIDGAFPMPSLRRAHRSFFHQRQFQAAGSPQLPGARANLEGQYSFQRRIHAQRHVPAQEL